MIKKLISENGIASLYTGIVPVLQSLCISNFVYFYTFHSLKAMNHSAAGQTAIRDLLLGMIAGTVNVLTTTPFWVVNTRLKKSSDSLEYTNLLDGLAYVMKSEGIKGLWAGTMPSLMLVSNPALQFMMYESLKRHLAPVTSRSSALTFFLIGALAKAFATIVTYPLQLIQTKLRYGKTDAAAKLPPDAGVIQMLLYILKANGFAGLFIGLEAKLMQTVLTAALMFAAYEKIAKFVMRLLTKTKSK